MNKRILVGLLLILCIVVGTGCNLSEATDPEVLFKVAQKENKIKYPAELEVKYYIPNDKKISSEKTLIVFKWQSSRFPYYEIFPVQKTEDGYVIIGSEYEDFSIPDPTEMGFSTVKVLDKQNGSFQMKFANHDQLWDFLNDRVVGWSNVVRYYSEDSKEAPQL